MREILCLHCRGRRRVLKGLSDYVFRVEYLRNAKYDEVHGTSAKFYRDSYLDQKAIMSHVLSSETGKHVARLLPLVEQDRSMFVVVRWKGLSASDDTPQPLARVYEDVPQLML